MINLKCITYVNSKGVGSFIINWVSEYYIEKYWYVSKFDQFPSAIYSKGNFSILWEVVWDINYLKLAG